MLKQLYFCFHLLHLIFNLKVIITLSHVIITVPHYPHLKLIFCYEFSLSDCKSIVIALQSALKLGS